MTDKKSDKELRQLWRDFGDTPINDDDEIEQDFLNFESGTDRFDVWHWFDAEYSHGVAMIGPDIHVEDIVFNQLGEDNQTWGYIDSNGDDHNISRDDVVEYLLSANKKERSHNFVTGETFADKDALLDYLKRAAEDMIESKISKNLSM